VLTVRPSGTRQQLSKVTGIGYAAWDLAFHTLPLSIVDPDFAKQQLELMLRAVYLHPSGQMPGSGKLMNLFEVSQEIANRLTRIFTRDEHDRRPVYGGTEKFQSDPNWRDYILFYEYFHGDNGAGLGASHQTGWTGVVAKLIQLYGILDSKRVLEVGKEAVFIKGPTAPETGKHEKAA
jgi:hypothetical protein